MNLLLDTNVVIDYIGQKPPFCEDASALVAAAYHGDAALWVPVLSLKDAFYVLSRYMDSSRVQDAILSFCEIANLVGITEDDALRGLRLSWPDFEDCLISICADKAKADYIVTRDSKGFDRSMTPICSPAEWLQMMRERHGVEFGVIG